MRGSGVTACVEMTPRITLHIVPADTALLTTLERRPTVNLLDANRLGGSVAEWLACWTQAQKGPGSNHSRDAVG